MKKNREIFCALLFALIIAACGRSETKAPKFSQSKLPSAKELPALREAALAGSGEAAMQMSLWQLKDESENEDPIFWTKIAAENGNVVGQYNLAVALMRSHQDRLSYIRGLYWLKKAADSGDEKSTQLLKEVQADKAP
jgi:TPR repeat protein